MGLNPSNVIYVSPVPNAGQFGLEVTELAAHIRLIREQLQRQIEKSNMRQTDITTELYLTKVI